MNIDKAILKLLNKSNSLEELEILESWKEESEKNIAFLNLMNTESGDSDYKEFDTEQAWSSIESKMESEAQVVKMNWLRYAAMILLLLTAGLFYMSQTEIEELPVYLAENEMRTLELQDNSKVWMNKNSVLEQSSDFVSSREVRLKGEAFFDIAHNMEIPFIVDLGGSEFVKVVGTSFNIINNDSEFDLRVYSGIVELHALNRVIRLEKGDRISLKDGAYVKLNHKDINFLSWKSNELIFEAEALKDVFAQLSKHYGVEFSFSEKIDFSKCSLRSKYKDQSIEDVLKEFEELYSLKYIIKDNEILIEELNCI